MADLEFGGVAVAGEQIPEPVAQALQALDEVRDLPPADQIGALTDAHRALRHTLDSIGDV